MSSPALSVEQIKQALSTLRDWRVDKDSLVREFTFADFPQAIEWMQECVEEIQARNHHPEWTNCYDKVTVRLTTHDADNRITSKDIEIAKILDWVATRYS